MCAYKDPDALGSNTPLSIEEEDAVEEDNILHRIAVDEDGTLQRADQVEDYLHRDLALSSVSFYDFTRCYKKVKRVARPDGPDQRRFALLDPHPNVSTHELYQRINPRVLRPSTELIPRVIGHKIPRKRENDDEYALFMLAHFMPFSASQPLTLDVGLWVTFQYCKTQICCPNGFDFRKGLSV